MTCWLHFLAAQQRNHMFNRKKHDQRFEANVAGVVP